MKKFLLFLMFALFCVPWAANAQVSIPYTEGFENMSSADDLTAAGWISSMSSTNSFLAIETSTSNVNAGSKALDIDSWDATSSDYVIVGLPVFDAAINTLQISFSYRVTSTSVAVGYLTDADDASTFVSLQSYSGSSSYTTKTVELSEAPATAARIAIKYTGYYRCYVDDIEVKALPSCLKPTSVTATSDGNVTWEGEGRTWNLNYKASSASTWTEVNGLTSMSYTIPDLASLTTYSVRVQNVCDDNSTTDWTYADDFTTPAGIPLVETFNSTSVPTAWTRYSGLLSGVMDGTVTLGTITSGWNFGTGNSVFDNHAKVNIYGTSCKYWLVTPALTMENNVQLSFDVAYTAYSGSGAPAQTGTDDKFVVLITTDGGTTWTILRQWDNAGSEYVLNNLNPTPVTVTYDLSSYAGQSIAVAFYAESTTDNADNNLHIDNVSIDYIPSCFKPTDLNATNITANTAELSWTANSGESAWKLYWKKASDENYTEESITSNPYTLSGLDDNTEYVFYVVANCGGSDGESEPSNTFSFATTCEAFEVTEETQYTYGFETPDLFACWTPIAGAAIQNNSNQAHESTYALKFSGTTNNMVALPPFVNATNTLRLEFWTRPESATNSSCGSFDVGYMTDLADANSFVAVATYAYNNWTSAEFEKKTVDFGNAPANAYIAMRQYNNSTSWYWFVDDVTVKLAPSCLAPTGLAVVENSVTAHEATLTWTAEEGATFQWHIDGTWADTQDNTVALTGLTAETDYTFTLRKKCSDSDLSEEITVSFHTPEACPAPTGFAVAENGLAGRTATLTWTGTSNSYTVSYRTKAYTDGIEEAFGTSIPSGWENKAGLLSSVMEGTALTTGSQWSFGTSNGVFDQHARINIYGTSRNGWLITPEVELPASAALSFDIALTDYNGTVAAPATTGTDDRFIVLISTDNEATWTILREWNNEEGAENVYNNIANTATGENVSIDLSAYADQSVRIAFYGESTGSNADNNLHIDNVAIGSPVAAGEWQIVTTEETTVTLTGLTPETIYEAKVQGDCGEEGLSDETALITFTTLESCPIPTNLAVNYTGGTEATISWTSDAEAWNMRVNGVDVNGVITNPYTLTGLELATTYSVEVQANCGEDGTSEWSNAVSFTTDFCMPENQCEITFELTDSYGDGWNGGAGIQVIDVETNAEIGFMTNEDLDDEEGEELNTLTLAVCDGREIQFVWVSGSYDDECSYVVKDANGEVIFSGEDAMDESVNYTVNCTTPACELVLDEVESFETYTTSTELWTGAFPDCWTIAHNYTTLSSDSVAMIYRSFKTHGYYSLRLHYRGIVAMPALPSDVDINHVKLNMNVRQSQSFYALQVGVMTDLDDESTFVPVALCNNPTKEKLPFECNFADYVAPEDYEGPFYIAFKNIGVAETDPHSVNYLDEVVVTTIDEAEVPACAITALEYTEFFDDLSIADDGRLVPECWTLPEEFNSIPTNNKPQLYNSFAHTGSYSLKMRDFCVYAMPKYAVPGTPITNVKMTFWLRQAHKAYQLEVGVMTDANDANTFVPVQLIDNETTGKEQVEVSFANYPGPVEGDLYIAFRNKGQTSSWTYSYNYIDDITLIDVTAEGGSKISETADGEVFDTDRYLENIAVYPNPTTGNLYIAAMDVQKVECFNQMGQLVGVYDNANELNISNLSNGVYMLRITVPQGVTMRKVVKR